MPIMNAKVSPTGQIKQKTGKEKIAEETSAAASTKNGPFFCSAAELMKLALEDNNTREEVLDFSGFEKVSSRVELVP